MEQIKRLRDLVDRKGMFWLTALLLAFIPLYPKIPLFSPIEQYIVRVRLEDVLVLITGVFWVWQAWKGRARWKFWGLGLVGVYALVGLLSLVSAVWWVETIPLQMTHILKSSLHYLRYLEYFSMMFFAVAAVKSREDIKTLVQLLILVVVVVGVYGWGQKYWQWPVYSTMNREYSKGVRLVLDSPYARVQSTFAGHYDYGAFLVVMLPVVLAYGLASKEKNLKRLALVALVVGVWGLVVSASRSSFVGYVVGVGVVGVLIRWSQESVRQKMFEMAKPWLWGYGVLGVTLLFAGGNITALFVNTLEGIPIVNQVVSRSQEAVVPQYTNPVPAEPENKPPDVYEDYLETVEVVRVNEAGETEIVLAEREPVFSECAAQKGLSLCIRLEALWPRAIAGFWRNPLLGSGYATLNKTDLYHLSEADSTDNNYLRVLGETGVLGFVAFYGLVVVVAGLGLKLWRVEGKSELGLLGLGFVGSVVGLLVNALYIDVFAASKVAYVFWGMAGLVIASFSMRVRQK